MTTGMTVAERWWEVGRRVENGEAFGFAVRDVFDKSADEAVGTPEWILLSIGVDGEDSYNNTMSILAYSLALEAEDEEYADPRQDCPWKCRSGDAECECSPPTADVVAEEEPIQVSQMERAGVGQAAFNGYLTKILDHKPERRSSWNAKLADGLRKWAHWLEERF